MTTKDLDLIQQSSLVTFSNSRLTARQINFITALLSKVQFAFLMNIDWLQADGEVFRKYFNLNKSLELEVTVPIKEVDKAHHTKEVIEELRKLRRNEIDYDIPLPNGGFSHVNTILVHSIKHYSNGNVTVGVGISALRWLLYYGKNHRLTIINQPSVLCLNGVYSKRIFQLLSHHFKQYIFHISIEELKNYLQTPDYGIKDFEQYVLLPAFYELANNPGCNLAFKYNFVYYDTYAITRRGRKGFNAVVFKVYNKVDDTHKHDFYCDEWEDRAIQGGKGQKVLTW